MIQAMLNSIITDTLKIGALKSVTNRQQETTRAVNMTTQAVAEGLPEDKKQEIKASIPQTPQGSEGKYSRLRDSLRSRLSAQERWFGEYEKRKAQAEDSLTAKYEAQRKQEEAFKKNVSEMKDDGGDK